MLNGILYHTNHNTYTCPLCRIAYILTDQAYDNISRAYTTVAADYPIKGVDAFWVSTISNDVMTTTPVLSNVLISHPDASPNRPGGMHVQRVLSVDELSFTVVIFTDGSVQKIDIAGGAYTNLANVFEQATFKTLNTDAHVIDGHLLKSFIKDDAGNSYLVTVDLSLTPATVSVPVKLIALVTNQETPIAAHMISTNPAMVSQAVPTRQRGSRQSI